MVVGKSKSESSFSIPLLLQFTFSIDEKDVENIRAHCTVASSSFIIFPLRVTIRLLYVLLLAALSDSWNCKDKYKNGRIIQPTLLPSNDTQHLPSTPIKKLKIFKIF